MMKRLLIFSFILILSACKKEQSRDYATVSGKIENAHESDTLVIFNENAYNKIIRIKEDGTFKDTLKIKEGDYTFRHGNEYGQIYLKNSFDSSLTFDYDNFLETTTFKGDGSDINNMNMQSVRLVNKYLNKELAEYGTKEDIDRAIENYRSDYLALTNKYADVDSTHLHIMNNSRIMIEEQFKFLVAPRLEILKDFPKGSASPKFVDYENFAGGTTSLNDLKGKYLYIDIWATWCPPCIKEIPSLKKLEKEYEDKNIQFVSISVDGGRGYDGDKAKAYEGWKKMVAEKELGGIQLIADKSIRSDFILDFKIDGIPRFILLDPDGNIVDPNAPSPSSPKLLKLFNSLDI